MSLHTAKLMSLAAAFALALTTGATLAQAQAKKKVKCKDGEVEEVAKFELSKGENIDQAINQSLTGKPGDPVKGLKWMVHRRLGNCIACHEVSKILEKANPNDLKSLKTYGFHGKIAPTLDGVADRYSEGELRLIVVSAKQAFPDADTIMPGFHVNDAYHRVIEDCKGHAILSAERIEDVVAYLKTLKD